MKPITEKEVLDKFNPICEECGTPVLKQFRYTDWEMENNDYWGDLSECVEMFNKAIKDDPALRCSIYDLSECPKCKESRDEGIIFNGGCPDYADIPTESDIRGLMIDNGEITTEELFGQFKSYCEEKQIEVKDEFSEHFQNLKSFEDSLEDYQEWVEHKEK